MFSIKASWTVLDLKRANLGFREKSEVWPLGVIAEGQWALFSVVDTTLGVKIPAIRRGECPPPGLSEPDRKLAPGLRHALRAVLKPHGKWQGLI